MVWAQLPLTTGYQDIDPADYNAPDPAGFIAGETGFPGLLPATTDVTEGKSVRGGENNDEVLTDLHRDHPRRRDEEGDPVGCG